MPTREVKTQAEYNEIPDDFQGTINITGGTHEAPLYINRNFPKAIQRVYDSAVIESVYGSAVIESVYDSAVIEYVSGSAVIESVYDSAVIKSVYDSAVIEYVSGSAVIESVSGSAVIKSVYDSAVIKSVSGSAVIKYVYGFAAILSIQGRSKVTTYGHNIVRYTRGEKHIQVVTSPNTTVVIIEPEVKKPKTLEAFRTLYPVEVKDGIGTLYKAVHKNADGTYRSDYKASFTYEIGKTYKEKCAPASSGSCSSGIHVAPLYWCKNFARLWGDAAFLECTFPIDSVVVSPDTDGKFRVSELTVIREVE